MKTSARILASIVLVALMASSVAVAQEDSAGMVVASRGEVIAMSNGGSRELKQGDFIYVKDAVAKADAESIKKKLEEAGAKVTLK